MPGYCRQYAWIFFLILQGSGAWAQENQAVPVKVVKAILAPIHEELPLTGSVTTRRLSRISPEVAGLVATIYVDEGDEVQQGDTLLELDKVIAEIDQAGARARVREAEAQVREAMRQRDEAAELVGKKHIAATRYEETLSRVDMDSAASERLRAELQRQREIVRRHTVTAPFAGVITGKMVEKGEWVKIDTALFELAEIELIRINVPVPQFYFSEVRLGTRVRITFDAYPERHFLAEVTMKVPMSNESARTFPVRIDLDNSDRLIAPGMSARVVFQLDDAAAGQTLLLPQDAIVRKPDGSESVWILTEEGGGLKARPVNIQTGRTYRENIEISAGNVRVNDRVVVRGNEILRPGQAVEIKEELVNRFIPAPGRDGTSS